VAACDPFLPVDDAQGLFLGPVVVEVAGFVLGERGSTLDGRHLEVGCPVTPDLRVRPPEYSSGSGASNGWPDVRFGCRRLRWGRDWLSGEGVRRRFEALVEELDVAVEAVHVTAKGRVGLVRCCGRQGGSFGLEPSTALSYPGARLLASISIAWRPCVSGVPVSMAQACRRTRLQSQLRSSTAW
jgi:hypothetical protein